MIVIIDYGMGNSGSIRNMLHYLGVESKISGDLADIEAASKLILPGVGSFDEGMRNLAQRELISPLQRRVVEQSTPLLGICLGMQLLTKGSEEGVLPGLGWVRAATRKFDWGGASPAKLKIPHMGWKAVSFSAGCPLGKDMPGEARFYFVHSYHAVCEDEREVAARAEHGYEFAAGFQSGNIMGMQFHPEKSHKSGMRLLRNFSAL